MCCMHGAILQSIKAMIGALEKLGIPAGDIQGDIDQFQSMADDEK